MMQPYSTSALEKLLAGGESDWVEFKQVWNGDARKKGTEAVCAFANDLANHNRPGVLFVGVQDDGTPSGLPIEGQLLEQLTGLKTDGRILPPPTLLVEKRKLKGWMWLWSPCGLQTHHRCGTMVASASVPVLAGVLPQPGMSGFSMKSVGFGINHLIANPAMGQV